MLSKSDLAGSQRAQLFWSILFHDVKKPVAAEAGGQTYLPSPPSLRMTPPTRGEGAG